MAREKGRVVRARISTLPPPSRALKYIFLRSVVTGGPPAAVVIFYMRNARANISIHKFHTGKKVWVGGWLVGWRRTVARRTP